MGSFDDLLSDLEPLALGRVTSYGYASDPYGDSASLGRGSYKYPTGAWQNRLSPTSFAASPDIERYMRQQGIQPMQPVEVVFDDGSREVRTWDDRTMQDREARARFGRPLTGRIDLYSPSGPNPANGRRVARLARANAPPPTRGAFDDLLTDLEPSAPAPTGGAFDDLTADLEPAATAPDPVTHPYVPPIETASSEGRATGVAIQAPDDPIGGGVFSTAGTLRSVRLPFGFSSEELEYGPNVRPITGREAWAREKALAQPPDSSLFGSAMGAIRQNVFNTAAGASDLVDTLRSPSKRQAFSSSDQAELDAVWKEAETLAGQIDPEESTTGESVLRQERLAALRQRAAELSNSPTRFRAGQHLRDEAADAFRPFGANPDSENTLAKVGRGLGAVTSALPWLHMGLAPAAVQMATTAYQGTYQSALNNGHAPDEAQAMATKAALQTIPATVAFMGAGKLAAGAAGRLAGEGASPMRQAIYGTGGAAAANVVSSAGIRSAEAGELKAGIPNLETLTVDGLFALYHGVGIRDTAVRQAVEAEAAKRGVELPEMPMRTGEQQYGRELDVHDAFSGVERIADPPGKQPDPPVVPRYTPNGDKTGNLEVKAPDAEPTVPVPTQKELADVAPPVAEPTAPPVSAPASFGAIEGRVKAAYDQLVNDGRFADVSISALQKRSGVPLEELQEFIRQLSRKGEAVPTTGYWSLSSAEERAAAIHIAGEPHVMVNFKPEAFSSTPSAEPKPVPVTLGNVLDEINRIAAAQPEAHRFGSKVFLGPVYEEAKRRGLVKDRAEFDRLLLEGARPQLSRMDLSTAEHASFRRSSEMGDTVSTFHFITPKETTKTATPNEAIEPEVAPSGKVERVTEGVANPPPVERSEVGAPPEVAPATRAGDVDPTNGLQGQPERVTSIKNAQTDIDRAAMALRPRGEPNERPWAKVEAEADAAAPGSADRLIAELKEAPRVVSDTESAMLAKRWTREKAALSADDEAIIQAATEGRDVEALVQQRQARQEQVQELADTLHAVGTKAGQALAARKMFDASEWTEEAMVRNLRARLKGRELTPEERGEVTQAFKKVEAAQKALNEREASKEEKTKRTRAEETAEEDATEARKTTKSVQPKPNEERAKSRLENAAEEARKRIQDRRGRASAGVDPTLLADYAIIGAYHISRGVKAFAQWGRKMIAELGDSIRPHLREIYDASKREYRKAAQNALTPADIVAKMQGRVAGGAAVEDLGNYARELGRAIIREHPEMQDPSKKAELYDPLFRELHAQMEKVKPGITLDEARDLYSDYGKITRPSQDPVSVAAREARSQAQKTAQIEDLVKKIAAKRTGPQRGNASDEVRRLEQQVKELLKQDGIAIPGGPEEHLRTAIQQIERRLENQLKDLAEEFDLGKQVDNRREPPTSEHAERLRATIEQVRETLKAIKQVKEKTPDERADAALKSLNRQTEYWKRRAEEDDFEYKQPGSPITRADVLSAQAQRDAASAEFRELQQIHEGFRAQQRAKTEAREITKLEKQIADLEERLRTGKIAPDPTTNVAPSVRRSELIRERRQLQEELARQRRAAALAAQGTPAQRMLAAWQKAQAQRTLKLRERIAAGDFGKKARKEPPTDPESLRLMAEHENAKRQFNELAFAKQLEARGLGEKAIDGIIQAINTGRAIKTSFDVSAILRQGLPIVLSRPIQSAKALGPMVRAIKSQQGQDVAMAEIRNNANYGLAKRSRLYLSEERNDLRFQEEAYQSRWARHIPGVAASQRAYEVFLNKVRMDTFSALVDGLGGAQKVTPQEARAIANYINVVTGRGNFRGHDAAAAALSQLFFSPRFVVSRFQQLAGQPIWGKDARQSPRVQRLIAKEYAKWATGLAIIYGLAVASSSDSVEADPRSSSFGKIRVGNTRFDMSAGLLNVATYISRMWSGETKSGKGEIRRLDEAKHGEDDASDTTWRFLRSKLAPLPGAILNARSGQKVTGEKTNAKLEAIDMVDPMSFGSVIEAFADLGPVGGGAAAALSLAGVGVQTYEDKAPAPKRRPHGYKKKPEEAPEWPRHYQKLYEALAH